MCHGICLCTKDKQIKIVGFAETKMLHLLYRSKWNFTCSVDWDVKNYAFSIIWIFAYYNASVTFLHWEHCTKSEIGVNDINMIWLIIIELFVRHYFAIYYFDKCSQNEISHA